MIKENITSRAKKLFNKQGIVTEHDLTALRRTPISSSAGREANRRVLKKIAEEDDCISLQKKDDPQSKRNRLMYYLQRDC